MTQMSTEYAIGTLDRWFITTPATHSQAVAGANTVRLPENPAHVIGSKDPNSVIDGHCPSTFPAEQVN